MDIKLRSSTKTPKTPALTEKKKQLVNNLYIPFFNITKEFESLQEKDTKYSEKETKCIADMKKLYLDTIKLDVDLQHGIYNLEKSFESKHDIIYDKRLQLLE